MRSVLITGGAKGIGASVAVAFAKEGYNVAINYLTSEEKANDLCDVLISSYGVDAIAIKADVSDYDECINLINETINHFGFIDVLVNNAGISSIKLLTETTKGEWDKIINTNLSALFNTSKNVLPYMIREHKGCIVNISSMWGEVGASCEVAYSTSKAGVIGFTKALAKEIGPSNIRVNCVSPGFILTDMNKELNEKDMESIKEEIVLDSFGTPKDVADAVMYLASDKARFITGQVLGVNGGMVI